MGTVRRFALAVVALVASVASVGCGAIDPVGTACGPVAEFAGDELAFVIDGLRDLRSSGWERVDVSPAMFAECSAAGDPVRCGYCVDAILDQVWE